MRAGVAERGPPLGIALKADERRETSMPGIYAAGDLATPLVASVTGIIARRDGGYRGKQAGGPERIGHVQNRLRVQLTSAGSVQFALPEVSSSPTNGEGWCLDDAAGWCLSLKFQKSQIAFEGASSTPYA